MARFSRIGKVYKLVRMTKLMRLVRIAKVKHRMVRHLGDILKISAGTERIIYILLTFSILQHVTACIWIFIGRADEDSKNNWIYHYGFTDVSYYSLYVTSLYFTVTTLQTVGYGDLSATNEPEKLLCCFLMILGVISFSYLTGSLSSVISSYDSHEAQLKEKMMTLNEIAYEYELAPDLFSKLASTLKYDHSKKSKDTIVFMEELPHKLKLELAMAVHKKMYANINFFQNKEKSFIAWVATLIYPMKMDEQEYIYKEGEEIIESKLKFEVISI